MAPSPTNVKSRKTMVPIWSHFSLRTPEKKSTHKQKSFALDIMIVIANQPLDSGYESQEDYNDLLLFLLVGQKSSKANNTMHKEGDEPVSLQPVFDNLHICQNGCQNQHRKDPTNDISRATTASAHIPTSPYLTARSKIHMWQCLRTSSRSLQLCQTNCSYGLDFVQ